MPMAIEWMMIGHGSRPNSALFKIDCVQNIPLSSHYLITHPNAMKLASRSAKLANFGIRRSWLGKRGLNRRSSKQANWLDAQGFAEAEPNSAESTMEIFRPSGELKMKRKTSEEFAKLE
jgi:hypothetical protein